MDAYDVMRSGNSLRLWHDVHLLMPWFLRYGMYKYTCEMLELLINEYFVCTGLRDYLQKNNSMLNLSTDMTRSNLPLDKMKEFFNRNMSIRSEKGQNKTSR